MKENERRLNFCRNPKLTKISSQSAVFEASGRVLSTPVLEWGNGQTSTPDDRFSWNRDIARNHFLSSVHLRKFEWFIIFTDDCRQTAEILKRKMIEFAPRMVGWNVFNEREGLAILSGIRFVVVVLLFIHLIIHYIRTKNGWWEFCQ